MVPRSVAILLVCTLLAGAYPSAYAQRAPSSPTTDFAEAAQLFHQRLYPDAAAALRAFRSAHPDHVQSPDGLFMEAQATLAEGRDRATRRLIDRLQAAYPTHPRAQEARLGLAQYYLDENAPERAKTQLRRIVRSPSGPTEGARALYMLGRTEQTQGNLEAAIAHFDQVVRRYPDAEMAPAAVYGKGAAELQLERFDAATTSFEMLGTEYPASPFSQNLGTILGEVYYRLDQYEKAASELQKRLPELPRDKRARALFLLAESYHQLGRTEAATTQYRTLLESHPDTPYAPTARYGLAHLHYESERYEPAARSFANVRQSNSPLTSRATYYEAASRAQLGETQQALGLYRSFLESDPDSRLAHAARYEVGLLLYQREEYGAAVATFRSLLRASPPADLTGDAYYWLGNAALANASTDAALDAYEQAIDRGRADASVRAKVRFQKAWSLYQNGRYEDAAAEFVSLSKSSAGSPRTQEALFWAGDSFYQLDNYTRARTLLHQYLESNPDGPQRTGAEYALAWTYFKQRSFEAAARHFREFLNLYDGDSEIPYRQDAQLRLADSYFAMKRYDDAIRVYRRVAGRGTDYALYQAGKALYFSDRPEEALATLRRFVQEDPDSPWRPDALYRIADIRFQQGNYETAREGFGRILNEYPNHELAAEAQYAIGDAEYNAGNMDAAVDAYRTVLVDYPGSASATEAASSLFFALNASGQQDRSESIIASIAENSSGDNMRDRLRFERARAAYQSGQSKRALRLFREFVRTSTVDSLLPSAYYHLGLLYADLDRRDEAKNYLNQLLNQYPESESFADAALRLGDMYLDEGAPEQALGAYRSAADAEQTGYQLRAQARYGQSMALLELGRPGEAETVLSQILEEQEQGPLVASARLGLGRIREQQGETDQALDLYRQVAESADSETGAEALFRLGRLYRKQGQTRTAIRELDRMSALFAGYPEWEARALLEQARAYRGLGETGQAVQLYDQVVDSYSGTPFAETARSEREALSSTS